MEEFLKKLSETGIKVLDLVEKGVNKLPGGFGAVWEALVWRTQITGIVTLVGSCLGLIFGVSCICAAIKTYKAAERIGLEPLNIFGCVFAFIISLVSVVLLIQPSNWFMAIAPEQYILSEIVLRFMK